MFFKVFNKKEELPGWTAHFLMNVSMMYLYWSRHSFSVTALRSICPARILTVPSSKSLCYRTAFYPCFCAITAQLSVPFHLFVLQGAADSWEDYFTSYALPLAANIPQSRFRLLPYTRQPLARRLRFGLPVSYIAGFTVFPLHSAVMIHGLQQPCPWTAVVLLLSSGKIPTTMILSSIVHAIYCNT